MEFTRESSLSEQRIDFQTSFLMSIMGFLLLHTNKGFLLQFVAGIAFNHTIANLEDNSLDLNLNFS